MIKRLAKCIREYKKSAILTPVFVCFEVLAECLIPFVMARLIDNGISRGDLGYVIKSGAVMTAFAAIALVFGALSGKHSAIAAAGFGRNLRHDIYYKVQEFSFANIDKFSTGGLVTRMTTDVTNIQFSFMMLTRIATRSPIMLVFALIMTLNISVRLSLIFLCAVPLLGAALYLVAKYVHPIMERVFKTYDKLNNLVQENLLGIRVVKSFVREDYEKRKFGAVSGEIYRDFLKGEKIIALSNPVLTAVIYACTILVSWTGARLIVNSGGTALTTGGLTSIFAYSMQILMSLMMLSFAYVIIIISRADAERVLEVLGEEPGIKSPAAPVTDVKDGGVRFDHVYFSYDASAERSSMSDVSLDIKSGETVGIIGGTGSSKSTLVQLIPRLYDATGGTVCVGGVDVRKYDLEILRDAVAMVLQKNELFSGTIKDNLLWGNENATDEELEAACRLAQADGFIRELSKGYDSWLERGGTNLSGGQKQRLCIARALLKKPKILILDDSSSAVDTRTDALIRKGLREFMPETTKIIIAQRAASVQDADKIIVMEGGRINAVGTHDELLASNDIYREVCYSQFKGGDEHARP